MRCAITIFSLLTCVTGYCQDENLRIIAKRYADDSIVLRWTPDSFAKWMEQNQHGYTINRYSIKKDKSFLKEPILVRLTDNPQKALLPNYWELIISENKYAAIFAQALYGESFTANNNHLVNKIIENKQRFSFAMLMADFSPVTAQMGGLRFVDTSFSVGDGLIYEIISGEDTAKIYVDKNNIFPTPKPYKPTAEFENKRVIISWKGEIYSSLYSGYYVEKFNKIEQKYIPLDDMPTISTDPSGVFIKLDSLNENYEKVYYKIRGITPFGDYGPYSDTLSGMGFLLLNNTPYIETHTVRNGSITINWEIEQDLELIKEFKVLKSNTNNGAYLPVFTSVEPTQKTFKDDSPYGYNYYKVLAIGKMGERKESLPYMVTLPDSIPPAIPTKLNGKIDSTGVVTLSWVQNSERDLLGYRVYKSFSPESEPGMITPSPVDSTVFIDSLSKTNVNRHVFYRVQSEDKRFNKSELSEAIKLILPDKTPPVKPVFTHFKNSQNKISLSWAPLKTGDLKAITLYRKVVSDSLWTPIFSSKVSHHFEDSLLDTHTVYQYTLLATDSSGNESLPAEIVSGTIQGNDYDEMQIINSNFDRKSQFIEIVWTKKENLLKTYIYRAAAEDPLTLYASSDKNNFSDKNLRVNTRYRYAIKGIYADGGETKLSKPITINY